MKRAEGVRHPRASGRRAGRGVALLCACGLLAMAAASGCDKNSPTPYLTPTGIRPSLANPTGGVFGVLHYAPAQRPDLADPPFPPTRVELLRGSDSAVVSRDTLPTSTRLFSFSRLQPGPYLVRAVARGFNAPMVRVTVIDRPRDAGDLTLPIDLSAYSSFIGIVGSMTGYDNDSYFLNLLNSPAPGFWSYPSDFHAEATVQVTPGRHQFMFVTDNSIPEDLIGWGGDASVTLSVPVVNAPVTFGHGAAHNLQVGFSTAGAYTFVLDEARQTFSITPAASAFRSPLASRSSR